MIWQCRDPVWSRAGIQCGLVEIQYVTFIRMLNAGDLSISLNMQRNLREDRDCVTLRSCKLRTTASNKYRFYLFTNSVKYSK